MIDLNKSIFKILTGERTKMLSLIDKYHHNYELIPGIIKGG
jgi:hypothetical protein